MLLEKDDHSTCPTMIQKESARQNDDTTLEPRARCQEANERYSERKRERLVYMNMCWFSVGAHVQPPLKPQKAMPCE